MIDIDKHVRKKVSCYLRHHTPPKMAAQLYNLYLVSNIFIRRLWFTVGVCWFYVATGTRVTNPEQWPYNKFSKVKSAHGVASYEVRPAMYRAPTSGEADEDVAIASPIVNAKKTTTIRSTPPPSPALGLRSKLRPLQPVGDRLNNVTSFVCVFK